MAVRTTATSPTGPSNVSSASNTATSLTAPTPRGQRTRDALIHATASLVAERGFHAVGISDIGAAAGVSGAAIYRHFANKDELLAAVFESVVDELIDGARRATTLAMLIDAHVSFAIRHRTVIRVYEQEAHNLSQESYRRVRRQQRRYANLWVAIVAQEHPAWTPAIANAAVHATFGLINSVSNYRPTLPAPEHRRLLIELATQVLAPTNN